MQTETNSGLVARQIKLLKSFASVSPALEGVAAFMWLPGYEQRFDGPRSIKGTRPLAVSLEVGTRGALTLAVAKSRPDNKKMRYECIMKKDFTQPMTKEGRGPCLSFMNDVMARRANGLLTSLVRFGERMGDPMQRAATLASPRHPRFLVPLAAAEKQIDQDKLSALAVKVRGGLDSVEEAKSRLLEDMVTRLSQHLSLVDSRIATDAATAAAIDQEIGYEDFTPVLGLPCTNPAPRLFEMANPAADLLVEHGVTDVGAVTEEQLERIVAQFRWLVPLGQRLSLDEIYDALCNPQAPVSCAAGFDGIPDEQVVRAMRGAAGNSRAAYAASAADLLAAASDPNAPLILGQLSRTQIVAAGDLVALPAPYAGHFLPDLDWQPPRRRAAIRAA
jgi:hypothetical protein